MRRVDLADLTAFVAVADNLSFRAAASHRIAPAEGHLRRTHHHAAIDGHRSPRVVRKDRTKDIDLSYANITTDWRGYGEVKSGAAHAEHDGERDPPGGHGATAQEVVSMEPGHAM